MAALSRTPFFNNLRNSGLDIIRDEELVRRRAQEERNAAMKEPEAPVIIRNDVDWPFVPAVAQDVSTMMPDRDPGRGLADAQFPPSMGEGE